MELYDARGLWTLYVLDHNKGYLGVIRQTYSKVNDVVLIYDIKIKLSMNKQGTMIVTEYYNTMKSFWLELDYYQDFKMQCMMMLQF